MADKEPTIALPPKVEDDVFGAAFAALTEDEGAPKVDKPSDPVTDAAQASNDAKADDKPLQIEIEGALPDPTKVTADGTVEGAPKVEDVKPADQSKMTDEQLIARFRDIVADTPANKTPAQEPAQPAQQPAAPSPVSSYSPEQQKIVDDYMREWPDVYAAEQLIRFREYQALTDHIFKQIGPVLDQLRSQTTKLSVSTHLEQLQAVIPDYNEVAPKVVEWIQQQPAYLKQAYGAVAQAGSVEDVADLVSRYRAATGTAAPTAAAPQAQAQPEQKPVVARVVKGLAPVQGKRTGVQGDAIAADDFEGAFAAFAKAS